MRRRVYEILTPARAGDLASLVFDYFIITLISINLVAFVIGTVESIYEQYQSLFDWSEYISVAVFGLEYLLRIWSIAENPSYTGIKGRARYAATPLMVIDFLAVAPSLLPAVGIDLRVLRAFRIVRLLRVMKIARYSESIQLIGRVFLKKRADLITAFGLTFLMTLFASTALYYAERTAQPDEFGSIPAAMWWAVATLTTVGYGDMYPVTVAGKIAGAIVAFLGIALFAIPTGILAAAFEEENSKRHK